MNLRVELKTKETISYEILIAEGIINKSYEFIEKYNESKIAVITDSNVFGLYPNIISHFKKHFKAKIIKIPAGEKSKSRKEKARIEDILLKDRFDRNSLIVAFGGGVVGDLSGFISATFLRGIDYIQIPTTLLAMVDSSVGGKTAISTPTAKNIIGAFNHPKAVFIDPLFLKTLPQKQFTSGLVESIKMALTFNEDLFQFIDNNLQEILKHDLQVLKHLIKESISLKIKTVMSDEKEVGIRQTLNYGHTIGHAIETLSNYNIPHGEAVAIGIRYAGIISNKLGILTDKDLKTQNCLFDKLGVELVIPKKMSRIALIKIMKSDKKNSNNQINFVLINKIGKVHQINKKYTVSIPDKEILHILKEN